MLILNEMFEIFSLILIHSFCFCFVLCIKYIILAYDSDKLTVNNLSL